MMDPSQTHKRRASYSSAFKKKAVKLAKKTASAAAAARQLKIPVANLYYWLKPKRGGEANKTNPKLARRPKTRRTYSAEFKLNAVQQVTETHTVAAVARELNIAMQTLHNWTEAAKAGRIGVTVTFTMEEISALVSVCVDRLADLKKAKAVNSISVKHDLMVLTAVSEKLKRINN